MPNRQTLCSGNCVSSWLLNSERDFHYWRETQCWTARHLKKIALATFFKGNCGVSTFLGISAVGSYPSAQLADFLKSRLPAIFTVQNDCRADFWEICPVPNSQIFSKVSPTVISHKESHSEPTHENFCVKCGLVISFLTCPKCPHPHARTAPPWVTATVCAEPHATWTTCCPWYI